jgi:hypothetical protein
MGSVFRIYSLLVGSASLAVWLFQQDRRARLSTARSVSPRRRSAVSAPDLSAVRPRPLDGETRVSHLTEREAADLVRWLESIGRTPSQFFCEPDQGFTVCYSHHPVPDWLLAGPVGCRKETSHSRSR